MPNWLCSPCEESVGLERGVRGAATLRPGLELGFVMRLVLALAAAFHVPRDLSGLCFPSLWQVPFDTSPYSGSLEAVGDKGGGAKVYWRFDEEHIAPADALAKNSLEGGGVLL